MVYLPVVLFQLIIHVHVMVIYVTYKIPCFARFMCTLAAVLHFYFALIQWLPNRATLLHVNTGYRLYCFSFGLTLKNRGKLVPLYMHWSFVFIGSFVSAVKNIRKSRTNGS